MGTPSPAPDPPRGAFGAVRSHPVLSLLLVPMVAWCVDSRWEAFGSWRAAQAQLVEAGAAGQRGVGEGSTVSFMPQPEQASARLGVVFDNAHGLALKLPFPMSIGFPIVQADWNDVYAVHASADGVHYREISRVPRHDLYSGGGVLRTRRGTRVDSDDAYTTLRILPIGEDVVNSVSAVTVVFRVASLRQAFWVPPLVWLPWLACAWLARRGTASHAARALRAWTRWDGAVAALACFVVLFRLDLQGPWPYLTLLALGAALLPLRLFLDHLAWARLAWLLAVAAVLLAVDRLGTGLVELQLARQFDLTTIDHRLQPDGGEINPDGLRFRGRAEDLREGDFVVAFLGDSFTYGNYLRYEESYPYVFETMLRGAHCARPVRSVNFAWPSSSPLLGLRLLEDVGKRYRPDLLVYNLDMTDFYDDLHHGAILRERGELAEFEVTSVWTKLALTGPWGDVTQPWLRWVLQHRRPAVRPGAAPDDVRAWPVYFATSRPLEQTRQWLERGVVANLARMHEHARAELHAPLALVMYPRAYQYSRTESPRNWERAFYEVMGPYAREPFRFFEERASTLPFPYLSLLPAFESAEERPLHFEDDPHWTPAGARVAARGVRDFLMQQGLLPCSAQEGSRP